MTPSVDWVQTIFFIVGGLGIFLYGIHHMGESMKLLAGTQLKKLIEKTTSTPFKGILMGILVTTLLQTSSGTTALTVGLVRAGLMTLPQAVGIILGANIGTTTTSFLVGLNMKVLALPLIGVGSLMVFFLKSKRWIHLGGATLGFGMIFYGLDIMGGALKVFVEFSFFEQLLLTVSNVPVLGVVMGAGLTALVQSSTATIGIMQELYTTGYVPLVGAIAIIFGSNIGTTITAILAAVGGSTAAKRTAAAHVIFNVVGSVFFLLIIRPYAVFITYLETLFLGGQPVAMTLSLAHIFFNVFATVIFYFFVKQLVLLTTKIIPSAEDDLEIPMDQLQDSLITESPILALENAKRVIMSMGDITFRMVSLSIQFSFENNTKWLETGRQYEEMVDTLDKKTHDYLVKLTSSKLNPKLSNELSAYIDAIRDFERIADHAQNLFDFFEHRYEKKLTLSTEATEDLKTLYDYTLETLQLTLQAFQSRSKPKAKLVLDHEDQIDIMVKQMRKAHVHRFKNLEAGMDDDLFVDILSNVERIGDHCQNIVQNVLYDTYYYEKTKSPTT
jgi:phosphate:Na+ symporter